MKIKRFFTVALSLALALSLTACTPKQDKNEFDNSSKYAKILEIKENQATLILGEIDENLSPFPEGKTPPPMQGGEIPSMPEGEMPPPMQGGEALDGSGTITPPIPFKEGTVKLTLNLNEETIKTLAVGDIVEVVFGENGTVKSITEVPPKTFEIPSESSSGTV